MNIKKIGLLAATAVASCVLFSACCSTAGKVTNKDFNTVIKGRVWQLSKVSDADGKIIYDYSKLPRENFDDIYTLQFETERVMGKASPNRYNGPYTLGEGNTLSFTHFASTLMMDIRIPGGLSEYDYFQLLEKVSSWKYAKNQLTLFTADAKGRKVTMVYNEFDYR